jgi:cystathionine gamma-synthase
MTLLFVLNYVLTAVRRFPYVDTLKILQKWGPGCQFFGNGDEYDAFEELLKERRLQNLNEPPFLALFCEVTSNPLLKTPDLRRLRALADEYNFAIVVDETVGNYANVGVLPYCDVVCDSLTKVFSGEVNVMGGGYVEFISFYIILTNVIQNGSEPSRTSL